MPSQTVVNLCSSQDTLTRAVANDTGKDISCLAKDLYHRKTGTLRRLSNSLTSRPIEHDPAPTQEDLDAAVKCGRFPHRPSDLFLKMYHDCLRCLERDPFVGCCSPPLLGSSGVIPVTVISIIPDIMRHYANVIVTAETEVFLATNFLQQSNSLTIVSDALKELSKRVGARGDGRKVIVKLMYDRGTPEQLVRNHAPVKPANWAKVGLPTPQDIPHLDMEVVNFHRPLLGTFHAKFAVVDRRVALISSNNIQDRANLEMMVHVEGPIVEGFYDLALWSWGSVMRPPLPLVMREATHDGVFAFGAENPYLNGIDLTATAVASRQRLKKQHTEIIPQLEAADPHSPVHGNDKDKGHTSLRDTHSGARPSGGTGGIAGAVHTALGKIRYQNDGNTQAADGGPLHSGTAPPDVRAATLVVVDGPVGEVSEDEVQRLKEKEAERTKEEEDKAKSEPPSAWQEFSQEVLKQKEQEERDHPQKPTEADEHTVPKSDVAPLRQEETSRGRQDRSERGSSDTHREGSATTKSDGDRESTVRSRSTVPTEEHDGSQPDRGSVENGDMQQDADERRASAHALSLHLNTGGGAGAEPDLTESYEVQDFRPFVVHDKHEPFPIALVNRPAHGMPGHEDILTPQNVAWLAGMKYAKQKVFIQSPTLNASPIVAAIIEACKRDVVVELWINLGFNDQGEMLPFQGGTNEEVVTRLYRNLNAVGKGEHLHVFWYVGKDQSLPLNAAVKKRNCHIKFMAVDDEVGIVGNGNQDTQSWFHSQEVNIMVDSRAIVAEWMSALRANQNTHLFGRVDREGVWRYENGAPLESLNAMKGSGALGRIKGFVGTFNRATGAGKKA